MMNSDVFYICMVILVFASCNNPSRDVDGAYDANGDTATDGDGDTDADGDGDGDTDADVDADGDTDGDVDADGDADGGGDADADGDVDAGEDAGDDADGELDAETVADADAPEGCITGDFSGVQGSPCACVQDCSPAAPLCTFWNPGSRYCAAVGCSEANAPACAEGSECVGIPGLPALSFCRQCLNDAGELGDPCLCDSDCATVDIDGRPRDQACVDGTCTLSPCWLFAPCPDGYECQSRGLDTYCVECLSPQVPAAFNEPCTCDGDCEAGLSCENETCSILGCDPAETGECPEGYECRMVLEGGTRCEPASPLCMGTGERAIGLPCACDADCSEEAPSCIQATVGGIELGGCTVRPCSLFAADPCPDGVAGGTFGCCFVPEVIGAPTCMSMELMNLVGLAMFCFP